MKILKLEFENINSLKGKHTIDFQESPFTENTLFAITGSTGSGKSTILDVICLALFNRIPRLGNASTNEIKKTGAIITRNQKEAMAAVTYEGKQGVFRSEWKISTARTGNLRDYEMRLTTVPTDQVLDLKKSEVPEANQQRIGLNYDQFVKSVMLAQGEFSEFLKAKKEVRGDLLEKITGTSIYRLLGQRCFERFKQESKAIEVQQNGISSLKKDILPPALEKEYTAEFREKNTQLTELEQTLKTKEKQLEVKKEIKQQLKKISDEKETQTQNKNEVQAFDKMHGQALQQHEKVEAEAENLQAWKQLKKEQSNLKIEVNKLQEKIKTTENDLHKCLKTTEALIGKSVDSAQLVKELQSFAQEVNKHSELIKDKRTTCLTTAKEIDRELEAIDFSWTHASLAKDQVALEALIDEGQGKIQQLNRELADIDTAHLADEKKRLTTSLERIREAVLQEKEITHTTSTLHKNNLTLEEIRKDLKELPRKIKKAETEIKIHQERTEKLAAQKEVQWLRASLEEHRQHLKDGESCPLCGATDHPFAQHLPKTDNQLTEQIRENNESFDSWKAKQSDLAAQFNILNKEQAKNNQEKKELTARLATDQKSFQKKFNAYFHNGEKPDWDHLSKWMQQQLENIAFFEQENTRVTALLKTLPLMEKLQIINTEGAKLNEELKILYGGKDINEDILQLSTQWSALQKAQINYKEQHLYLQQKTKTLDDAYTKCTNQLQTLISDKEFDCIEDALKALMPSMEVKNLRDQRGLLQEKITAVKGTLKTLNEQVAENQKKDIETEEEALRLEFFGAKKTHQNLTEETKELDRKLRNQHDNQKKLNQLIADIADQQKQIRKWQLLNELIGDRQGKTFNDFAQDLNLKHLIHLANKRLKTMSDRYLIDQPKADEDNSLTVIDQEMGGQRRSVKTLSGGETFILSLSMALALSDLASKNVSIKSLFIDEGFGTLDPETLDQTLDTLERLQAESSKTIGIISHVESLKERIATQIQLNRNGQGYSSIKIIG